MLYSNKTKIVYSYQYAVIRVHQVLNRKEKSWKRGQKIKVLKGACAGCHRTTIYATIEYFLLEGFEGDAGGELCDCNTC